MSHTMRKVGRPSGYSQALADKICEEVGQGRSLRSVLSDEGMPRMAMVFRWLRDYDEFSDQYARAKQESADSLADNIEDIANAVLQGRFDPNAARVAIDAKKWIASKLKPKKYGERIDHTTDGQAFNFVVTRRVIDADS